MSQKSKSVSLLGRKVRITIEGWEGRKGIVTSVGNEALPIHVTLEGESWETDFTPEELEVSYE